MVPHKYLTIPRNTSLYWHYQLALLVTFLHAPFLFLLHQSGILYLHMFALSTISVHLSVILNHIFSSQLSLPSHSVPAPPIRSSRFWRSINLVVCMYVCMFFTTNSLNEAPPVGPTPHTAVSSHSTSVRFLSTFCCPDV